MIINKDTKISKILKEYPAAMTVIANIQPKFKKLENPILRRSLATRVSVKDAARIGNMPVNEFLKSLEEAGFPVEYSPTGTEEQAKENLLPPDFSDKEIVTFDARPVINEGKDPFGYINKIAKNLKPNQVLLIINDFEPIPLIDYLIGKNFVHWLTQDQEGNYLSYFKLNCQKPGLLKRLFGSKNVPCRYHDVRQEKQEKKQQQVKDEHLQTSLADFNHIQSKYAGNLKEIDVRHLEMPLPMQTILENLTQLKPDEALFVRHKRLPQFLLPELKKRDFSYVAKEIDPDNVHLIIYKQL